MSKDVGTALSVGGSLMLGWRRQVNQFDRQCGAGTAWRDGGVKVCLGWSIRRLRAARVGAMTCLERPQP
jgi:hypothetical protein